MTNSTPSLPPGFRFHPTDEELILHYLRNHASSSPCPVSIVAEVDIYKSDPWDLPKKAMYGDREWYFFSPRDRKYPNGVRPNRAAGSGYWKATGTDKPIVSSKGNESIGVKKALVFYKGKPPKGIKTNWIMHEYRLAESRGTATNNSRRPMKLKDSSMRLDEWVLCRIYQKSSHVQEDSSTGRETELPNLPESPQESKPYLPKTASLTELFKEADYSLLSRLLEAPIETAPVTEAHDVTFGYATTNWNQPFVYNMNHQVPEAEHSSVPSFAENGFSKRQRVWEEGGSPFQYLSNNNNSNVGGSAPWACNKFSGQFDSLQAFLNQQLLLKTHLGMQ